MAENLLEVDDSSFEARVLKADKPVLPPGKIPHGAQRAGIASELPCGKGREKTAAQSAGFPATAEHDQ